jgi:adenylosuccinate synthase
LPALRYAVRVNGLDGIALTKLDVLTGETELRVCTRYKTPHGETDELPIDELDRATPIYETVPGWKDELSGARKLSDLPTPVRSYIERIEKAAGCPVVLVSVGFRRDETVLLADPFAV